MIRRETAAATIAAGLALTADQFSLPTLPNDQIDLIFSFLPASDQAALHHSCTQLHRNDHIALTSLANIRARAFANLPEQLFTRISLFQSAFETVSTAQTCNHLSKQFAPAVEYWREVWVDSKPHNKCRR